MERLRNVAIQPDLKNMKIGMRRVLAQQRIEKTPNKSSTRGTKISEGLI